MAFTEELLFRGYPFQLLLRTWGSGWTLLGNSAVFACAHLLNPSVNALAIGKIGLAGALFGAAYLAGRSLALPVGMHFAWNFVQATVCGYPVSGLPGRSVLVAVDHGPALITGGPFGPEGGLLATVVLLGGTALLFAPRVRGALTGGGMTMTRFPDHPGEGFAQRARRFTQRTRRVFRACGGKGFTQEDTGGFTQRTRRVFLCLRQCGEVRGHFKPRARSEATVRACRSTTA